MKGNIRYSVIVNMIRTVTITVLSFISFPFVCRALGDAGMGTYTWANTFVYYFLTLAKLGIPSIAIRECTKVRDDKKALSKKVQEFFILQAILTVLSFLLMVSIMFVAKGDLWENRSLIFILSTNFLIGAFSFEWVYIALEKHYFTSFRSIFALLVSAMMIMLFIKLPENGNIVPFESQIYLYALFACMTTYVTVIINLLFLRKYVSFKKEGKYNFKQYFSSLFVIFILSFMLTLYNQSDSFILGFLNKDKSEVGSFSVGIKAIEIIITIITSLSAVFIPRATHYYKMENKYFFNNLTRYSMNICFFIAIPAIATLTTLSSTVTSLISGGEGYINAASVLIIISSMCLTYSIGDMIYNSILLPMKKEKYYLISISIGVVLDIILSIILGLIFKENPSIGIAIATAVSDLIILIILIVITKEYSKKAIFNLNNLKILIAGIFVTVSSIFLIKYLPFNNNPLLLLIVTLLIDAFLYIGILIMLNENLVASFLRKKEKTSVK